MKGGETPGETKRSAKQESYFIFLGSTYTT